MSSKNASHFHFYSKYVMRGIKIAKIGMRVPQRIRINPGQCKVCPIGTWKCPPMNIHPEHTLRCSQIDNMIQGTVSMTQRHIELCPKNK
jgi:hypothetical protein